MKKRFGWACGLVLLASIQLRAESRSITLLFYHFEPRSYNLKRQDIPDSVEAYIRRYGPCLADPKALKERMLADFDFAVDQLAQKRIFRLLDRFKARIAERNETGNIDLTIKVHFILWDEAFEFLQKEARGPSFDIVQIAPEFLGGIAEHGNVIPLDRFMPKDHPDRDYAPACLQSCRVGNKGPLLALPFWASMRALLVRKDMLESVPGIDPEKAFSSWENFERTGRIFNGKIDSLRRGRFPNLRSFWAVNIHDKDMNTLQNMTPLIYSHGGRILKDKLWWKEVAFNQPPAMEGIRTYFEAAKSVGSLEESTFGELLNRFHSGCFAAVLCGTWDLAFWRSTTPDSSSLIEIRLPPTSHQNPATLLEGCSLVILKRPGVADYRLRVELLRYLSTDPLIQREYIPSCSRLSVLKSAADTLSRPEYYVWLNQSGLARPFPNGREMALIFNALTHKYRLASILQNIRNAPSLSENVQAVADDAIRATADNLNRQIIPAPIYYAFYTKINILVILFLLGGVAFSALRLTRRLKRLSEEKERMESDLSRKLQAIQQDKLDLEQRQRETIQELQENRTEIRTLSAQLSLIGGKDDDPNLRADWHTIEQVSTQILSLTSKSRTLQAELDRTSEKIMTSEQEVSQLENELGNLKNPEVFVDFQKKAVFRKDGSEFVLSNAARQYKMDFFRYLEFAVRHRMTRMHLLVFGYLDMEIFRKALLNRTVREYNYKGKFGKVKSGINRTFRNNVGRDLIVHDDLKVYVYYKNPGTIYQIAAKDREIDIPLIPLTSRDRPQVVAFSAYENLDYYAFDPSIRLNSNIQESKSRFDEALKIPDPSERSAALEDALLMDPRNYPCLFALLEAKPFDFLKEAEQAEKDLEECAGGLETFLSLDLEYGKKISNLSRIKEDYRDVYSWSRVEKNKSDEIEKLGLSVFREIVRHERTFLESLLAGCRERANRLHFFTRNMVLLQDVARRFRGIMDPGRLQSRIQEYARNEDLFAALGQAGHANPFAKGFVAFLAGRMEDESQRTPDAAAVQITLDFVDWFSGKKGARLRETNQVVSDYCRDKRLSPEAAKKLERFAASVLK
jgi:maltose-binding protein MalE